MGEYRQRVLSTTVVRGVAVVSPVGRAVLRVFEPGRSKAGRGGLSYLASREPRRRLSYRREVLSEYVVWLLELSVRVVEGRGAGLLRRRLPLQL